MTKTNFYFLALGVWSCYPFLNWTDYIYGVIFVYIYSMLWLTKPLMRSIRKSNLLFKGAKLLVQRTSYLCTEEEVFDYDLSSLDIANLC